ncbi:hypothetical protein [Soonwooa sp.]|uniref:hypothetical protein n=1 Tax=Soonwooa sp. TaxID=1938592 RepID=UPI0028ACAD3C|nr:hypothetical protein [Soonwooa sp.]
MKNIFISFLSLSGVLIFAQEAAPLHIQNMSLNAQSIFLKDGFKTDLGTEGIPYINNDLFSEAKVGTSEKLTSVRYNASLDQFEFLQNGQMLLMGKEDWYSPVYFPSTNEFVVLGDIIYKNKSTKSYLFEYIKGDKVSAYRKISKTFKKGEYAASSFDKDQPNRFREEPDQYYLKLEDGKFVEFPKNKKKLIELFPDKKKSINDNVISNDFDFNTKKLIVSLLNR